SRRRDLLREAQHASARRVTALEERRKELAHGLERHSWLRKRSSRRHARAARVDAAAGSPGRRSALPEPLDQALAVLRPRERGFREREHQADARDGSRIHFTILRSKRVGGFSGRSLRYIC